MATVSKVNSDILARGTLESTAQLKVVTLTDFDSALTADTQAGGAGTAITEGTIRAVAQELSPMLFETNAGGTIMAMVMDGHAIDATSIGLRVDQILGQTAGTTTVAVETSLATLLQ